MTVQAAQAQGLKLLAAAGIDTPALDASLLLAETLGLDRTQLILAYPNPLPNGVSHHFEELIRRRLAGESVAYILGRKEFRGLEFTVSPAVLVPRPDTETLVEAALSFLGPRPPQPPLPPKETSRKLTRTLALDLCTGSGAVAIALKHEAPDLEIWASDISPEALEIARCNAARLLAPGQAGKNPAPQGSPPAITFVQSSLFDRISGRFHLITANPPYIESAELAGLPAEVRREPRLALDGGTDGLDLIRRIVAGAPGRLYAGGALLLEADPRQMGTIRDELEKHGFKGIQIYNDLSGAERVIGGCR